MQSSGEYDFVLIFYKQHSCKKKPVILSPLSPSLNCCFLKHQKNPTTTKHTFNSALMFLIPLSKIFLTKFSYIGSYKGKGERSRGFSKIWISIEVFWFYEEVSKMYPENELPIIVSTVLMCIFCGEKSVTSRRNRIQINCHCPTAQS